MVQQFTNTRYQRVLNKCKQDVKGRIHHSLFQLSEWQCPTRRIQGNNFVPPRTELIYKKLSKTKKAAPEILLCTYTWLFFVSLRAHLHNPCVLCAVPRASLHASVQNRQRACIAIFRPPFFSELHLCVLQHVYMQKRMQHAVLRHHHGVKQTH